MSRVDRSEMGPLPVPQPDVGSVIPEDFQKKCSRLSPSLWFRLLGSSSQSLAIMSPPPSSKRSFDTAHCL